MARTKEFDVDATCDKAIDLFAKKGYEACSMQDIVDALAISRSSLYDTYGDKRQLYIAALTRYGKVSFERLSQLFDRGLPVTESFRVLFQDATLQCSADSPRSGCFMVNTAIEVSPHDKEINDIVIANNKKVEDLFYSVIKSARQSGHLSVGYEPRAMARFLFNNLSGIRVAAKTGVSKDELNDIVGLALSVLQ